MDDDDDDDIDDDDQRKDDITCQSGVWLTLPALAICIFV